MLFILYTYSALDNQDQMHARSVQVTYTPVTLLVEGKNNRRQSGTLIEKDHVKWIWMIFHLRCISHIDIFQRTLGLHHS